MASEAFFILRDGGCLWGGSVNAVATETGYLPFAMTGTNAADLAGAILVAAETNSLTSRWSQFAGITNLRRIGSFSVFGGIAVAGIATLLRIRVAVTGEGLDDILVASGARLPLGILSRGRIRDQEYRN